ncbi:hypothetical protein [Pimelobacter simplex]|uniref:hypothetical protein n=1 Tax=Nocardioides simplex TaxID=2045 RepID=UPI0021500FCA|nr:hypothetical protein [Pimelobacter simplex]UUW87129.1 hypothetical protein M0M43_15385 [Pimelobacter simplex]UUW96635.1 hypothetical protein M0M48_04020 [Pimelobacter simplex]
MSDDLQTALWQAGDLPNGKTRSRAFEAVAQRADGVDLDVAFEARVNLAHSYVMGGERRRMMVPFAWCLAESDKDPARFEEHTHMLLWAFKYVPSTLVRFPEVPLAMTLSTLDDMERRYRLAGQSMHAVHMSRHSVARHVGDLETAAEEFRLWRAAPRDDLSDCLGCDPSNQVEYLTQHGRYAEAVGLARPVLAGSLTCSEQPQEMQAIALESFVAEGLLDDAVQAHRAGYRAHRGRARHLGNIAHHLRFCASTGNDLRALEILDAHLPLIDDADSTASRMEVAVAAAHALRRLAVLDGGLTVRTTAGQVPVGQAADELATLATDLAALFDERNGTGRQGELVQQRLAEEPWLDYLPLSATAERAHRARQRMRAAAVVPDETAAEPLDGDVSVVAVDELLDVAEAAWWDQAVARAGAAWAAFEEAVAPDRRTALDGARLTEGAALRAWADGDLDGALEGLRTALLGYDGVAAEERALRTRARIAGLLIARGEIDEAVATGEGPIRALLASSDDERRTTWIIRLARLLVESGRADEAEETLGQADLTALSRDDRMAGGFLAGEIATAREQHELAIERFTDVVELAADGPELVMPLWRRGRAHLALGSAAGAVDDLGEAVAVLSVIDQRNPMLQADLAEAYLQAGDPDSAAQAAEEMLVLIGRADRQPLTAHLHDLAMRASEALADWTDALERARLLQEHAIERDEPGWLLHLIDREATFLEGLELPAESAGRWAAGADLALGQGWDLDAVRFLRCAAGAAHWAGDDERAAGGLETATARLAGLDPAEPEVRFHGAGVLVQRAELALAAGDPAGAGRLAREGQAAHLAIGATEAAVGALLLRLDAGDDVPVAELRALWDELDPERPRWYRLGYCLADALRDAGDAVAADEVTARLDS